MRKENELIKQWIKLKITNDLGFVYMYAYFTLSKAWNLSPIESRRSTEGDVDKPDRRLKITH